VLHALIPSRRKRVRDGVQKVIGRVRLAEDCGDAGLRDPRRVRRTGISMTAMMEVDVDARQRGNERLAVDHRHGEIRHHQRDLGGVVQ
jgi:hypothetical protein